LGGRRPKTRDPERRRGHRALERDGRPDAREPPKGASTRHRPRAGRLRRRAAAAGGGLEMTEPWWVSLIKAAVIVNLIMLAFAYTTWLERKLLGRMQNRYGPNRAGPYGLLQPFADLIKLVRKESFFPVAAQHPLYIAATIISMFTALAAVAVLPFGAVAKMR